jgi:hypothetical protein
MYNILDFIYKIYYYIKFLIVKKKFYGYIRLCKDHSYNNNNNIENNVATTNELSDEFLKKIHYNNKITYIIHNKYKYRIILQLSNDYKYILKSLKHNINKIELDPSIKVFGKDNYINCIYDIKYLTLTYRYFYKTDLKSAYSSINIFKLFEYIKNKLNKHDYDLIYKILTSEYTYSCGDIKRKIKLSVLYQGLPISYPLYSIYITHLLHEYKKRTNDSNIIVYVDDILMYSNNIQTLIKNVEKFNITAKEFDLIINKKKSSYVDISKNSLIFLKRIIVSNFDREEKLFLDKYINYNILTIPCNFLTFIDINKLKKYKKIKNINQLEEQQKLDCENYNAYIEQYK